MKLDLKKLLERKDKVVGINTGGIRALFKAYGITTIEGEAVIPAPGIVKVGKEELHAKNIISRPAAGLPSCPAWSLTAKRSSAARTP